ncbi:LacI family DNA-binding transcriptional regulator [Actinoplanes sp. NPDC048796]|uniref:LacI family DNA-binding transcriptional regulator n=1 Tax=unclassified Actinoplanes TaxID=2626549 RepID=UPI0033E4AECA
MARIEDVARQAGVSVGTVSNVLNRPDVVAPATRERVTAAIASLGYVLHEPARALKAGRSRTVGLIVPDIANPFFADVARGAERVADRHDVIVTLYNSAESADRELRHFGRLEEQRAQGVLVTPVGGAVKMLEAVRRRGTPVVLIDRGSKQAAVCSVAVDNQAGGRLAAAHLLALGHRRLAFAGGPLALGQVADRLAGARREADAAGATLEVLETSRLDVAAGRTVGAALAARSSAKRPTAVFCGNDLVALGVLQAVTRDGLRLPDDLAVVGYDDIAYAAAAAVPLTSIRQPRQRLGQVAADLLFDEIDRGADHSHQQIVFDPELIVRQSTTG